MTTPTGDQIEAVLKFLPKLKRKGFKPSKWHGSKTLKDGAMTFPWEEHSALVSEFVSCLYNNGFVQGFDWSPWQRSAVKYFEDGDSLKKASLATLVRLLTLHVRKDRFFEGHLSEMIRCGHIVAILERLADLRR